MILSLVMGLVAAAYAMVGHGGASGYLACGLLAGLPLQSLRGQALVLNLVVAGMAAWAFARAGYLRWRILGPLVLSSIPAAYLGARFNPASSAGKAVIGTTLVIASLRLLFQGWLERHSAVERTKQPPFWALLLLGGGLGLLSGWSGVGGGIYLSPLLLLLRWASFKETACTSACFIWLNSASGIASLLQQHAISAVPWPWLGAAVAGGALGSVMGAFKMKVPLLRFVLCAVLGLAAFKLLGK